jgi:hypothetical protein
MTTGSPISILTDDESSIIKLLESVHFEADEFDDPENGDYLDRLENLFGNATELDATVVKIALERTHFFMGGWTESSFTGDSYEVIPASSASTDHLRKVLGSVWVAESRGLKNEILKIVDSLQVTYFWRDSDNPNPEILRELTELMSVHNVSDEVVAEFVQWNILFPWNEYLGIQFKEVPEDSKYSEWDRQCKAFNALG